MRCRKSASRYTLLVRVSAPDGRHQESPRNMLYIFHRFLLDRGSETMIKPHQASFSCLLRIQIFCPTSLPQSRLILDMGSTRRSSLRRSDVRSQPHAHQAQYALQPTIIYDDQPLKRFSDHCCGIRLIVPQPNQVAQSQTLAGCTHARYEAKLRWITHTFVVLGRLQREWRFDSRFNGKPTMQPSPENIDATSNVVTAVCSSKMQHIKADRRL
jgi:hypothetical protein